MTSSPRRPRSSRAPAVAPPASPKRAGVRAPVPGRQRRAGQDAIRYLPGPSLQVESGNDVWLRSAEANIKLGGQVALRKDAANQRFDGSIEVERGTYRLALGRGQRTFEVESRTLRFYNDPQRRGARIEARIAGAAMRFEPVAEGKEPTGDGIVRAIRAALAAADVKPGDIGHVNAHGNSTREDDPIEARAIRETLGDVPVTAPKSYFGNLGQGSGMVELVVSLLAMSNGAVPPTLNYETPDPECPVNVVASMQPAKQPAFVKLNHNSMGQAAAVVIAPA